MSNNPRLLAVRRSVANCTSRPEKRERIEAWLLNPRRMHDTYKVPGTVISKPELKQARRVLTLWLATYRGN